MRKLALAQHWIVTRAQLLELGFSESVIKHRVRTGRLHRVHRGVYVLGRPQLSRHGRWMAALLACGPEATLSHATAAAIWEIRLSRDVVIEVSVPAHRDRRPPGIAVHRRSRLEACDRTARHGLAVTTPAATIIDLAPRLDGDALEKMINEADKLGLLSPEGLRKAAEDAGHRPGAAVVRRLLDRLSFRLTDSELEQLFLRLVRAAGLPIPHTGRRVNGFKVDFFWPDLGLVVETDGLRYHRTPAQQARDRRRDQAHTAAGLTVLRFTHAQIAYEPDVVTATLTRVVGRLEAARA